MKIVGCVAAEHSQQPREKDGESQPHVAEFNRTSSEDFFLQSPSRRVLNEKAASSIDRHNARRIRHIPQRERRSFWSVFSCRSILCRRSFINSLVAPFLLNGFVFTHTVPAASSISSVML